MSSRFDNIQSRSIYIGASTNPDPALGNLIVDGDVNIGGMNISGAIGGGPSLMALFKPSNASSVNTGYQFQLNPAGGAYGGFSVTNVDPGVNQTLLQIAAQNLSGDSYINVPTTAQNISLRVSGTPYFYLQGSSGNVGIGTTSPSAKLHVVGGGNIAIIGSAGSGQDNYIKFQGSSNAFDVGTTTSGYWGIADSGVAYRFVVTQAGNVGIGVTNPSYTLDVVGEGRFGTGAKAIIGSDGTYSGYSGVGFGGTTNGYNRIFGHEGTSDGLYLSAATGNGIWFWTNGSNLRMTISPSGNVGIGTTTPAERLDVFGRIQARPSANGSVGNNWYMIGSITDVSNFGVANGIEVESAGSNSYAMTFGTQNTYLTGITEKMRITSGGNLLVGTTTNLGADINANSTMRIGVAFNSPAVTYYGDSGTAYWTIGRPAGSGNFRISSYALNALEIQPTTGNVGIGTTSPYSRLSISNGNNTRTGLTLSDGDTASLMLFAGANAPASISFDTFGLRFVGGSTVGTDNGTEFMRITTAGNVGIGTTSPTSKLTVNGNAHITGAGVPSSGAGMELSYNGGISYIGSFDRSNGLYRTLYFYSSDTIFENGGSERMRITSSGAVGIGTSNPGYRLDVNGDGRFIFRNSSNEIMDLLLSTEAAASKSKLSLLWYGNETAALKFSRGGNSTGGSMEFWTQQEFGSTTQRMTITSSGNVGIGTTSPSQLLTINGADGYLFTVQENGPNNSRFQIYQDNTDSALVAGYNSTSTNMTFYTGSSERLRISANGNIGIGTSSPGVKLHVIGDIGVGVSYNGGVYASTGSVSADLNWGFDFLNTSGLDDYSTRVKFYPSSGSTRKLGFWNSQLNSYMAYFDGSLNTPNFIVNAGNVGIGTSSPDVYPFAAKLNVAGNISINGTKIGWGVTDSFSLNGIDTAHYGLSSNFNLVQLSGYYGLVFATTGYERMRISDGGNVGIGTTAPVGKLTIKSPGEVGSYGDGFVFQRNANTAKLVRMYESSADGFLEVRDGGDTIVSKLSGYTGTPSFFLSNVGIGTNSPQSKLSVSPSDNDGVGLYDSSNNLRGLLFVNNTSGVFSTGIRTANYWLDLDASGVAQNAIRMFTGTGGIGTGSERMRITASGNVGIGTTSPGAKLEIYGSGSTGSTAALTVRNAVGTKLVNVFDDGLIQLNNLLNINQAIYINSGNSNRHYALESHIFNVVDSSFQRIDFVTIQGNLQSPAMGVGTMSPERSAILDVTSRSKGFLPPRMTNTEMNAISTPAAGLVVYDTSNNKLTVYNGSTWVPLH